MPERPRSRLIPTDEKLAKRAKRLESLGELVNEGNQLGCYSLEPGNKKTGINSDIYKSVFVWNIPPVSTCPGRSAWCSTHCYNGDDRPELFPIKTWVNNWWGCTHDIEGVKNSIIAGLKSISGNTALRIHSSGDFFSLEYIKMWGDIIDCCAETDFWAYTRSWVIPELLSPLSELRRKANLQLFASWDVTMPSPPKDWRLSYVDEPFSKESRSLLKCPEQYDLSKDITCASCRYCLTKKDGDVLFVLH